MVWHDHELIQFRIRKVIGNDRPALVRYVTCAVQLHSPAAYFPKQAQALAGAHSDEVRARLGIIEPLQPDRAARPPAVISSR